MIRLHDNDLSRTPSNVEAARNHACVIAVIWGSCGQIVGKLGLKGRRYVVMWNAVKFASLFRQVSKLGNAIVGVCLILQVTVKSRGSSQTVEWRLSRKERSVIVDKNIRGTNRNSDRFSIGTVGSRSFSFSIAVGLAAVGLRLDNLFSLRLILDLGVGFLGALGRRRSSVIVGSRVSGVGDGLALTGGLGSLGHLVGRGWSARRSRGSTLTILGEQLLRLLLELVELLSVRGVSECSKGQNQSNEASSQGSIRDSASGETITKTSSDTAADLG